MGFERARGGSGFRQTAWGPSNGTKKGASLGLGLGTLNRNSMFSGRFSGRLIGGRLGLGGGGLQAHSSSSSMRHPVDDATPELRFSRATAAEQQEELIRMRVSIEELSRKMDAILSQHSG
jgi:hypothetical protein